MLMMSEPAFGHSGHWGKFGRLVYLVMGHCVLAVLHSSGIHFTQHNDSGMGVLGFGCCIL